MAVKQSGSGDVSWIKLATNIFQDDKIRLIKSMKNGNDLVLIWIALLCMAGRENNDGEFALAENEGYTNEMLAVLLDASPARIKEALSAFKKFGMIDIDDCGIITIVNWEKHQNLERLAKIREANKQYQRRARAKKSQENGDKNNDCQEDVRSLSGDCQEDVRSLSVPCQGAEVEVEEEEEVEEDIDTLSNSLSKKRRAREKGKEESKTEANVQNSVENSKLAMSYLGGSLGEGVVLISEEQAEDLLARLTLDEFNHYVGVVRDSVLKGRRYGKTHYKAILDMAEADRAISRPKAAGGG